MTAEGEVLFTPDPHDRTATALGRFLATAEARFGVRFADYEAAWRWSVEHLEDFWQLVWDDAAIISHTAPTGVLTERTMPFATWFPGATLNYAEHALRDPDGTRVRVRARSQTRDAQDLTGAQLADLVGRIQAGLRAAGVGRGDRVVGYLPNIPEALATHLAAAGLGAIWCSVPAEMGPRSVLDRVAQLEPALLVCVDGYRWGERVIERGEQVAEIRRALDGVAVVQVGYLEPAAPAPDGAQSWTDFTATPAEPVFEAVPFDHPLVVLFSSGTTGLILDHLRSEEVI